MHVVERFALFAGQSRNREFDPQVLHHAKRAVIDWYAAAFAGAALPPAALLEKSLSDELDRGKSRLLLGRKASPRAAALINGAAAHAAEFDDIYPDPLYHPSPPPIPPPLPLPPANS